MLASALKEDNDTTGAMLMEIDQSLKLIETLEACKQKTVNGEIVFDGDGLKEKRLKLIKNALEKTYLRLE